VRAASDGQLGFFPSSKTATSPFPFLRLSRLELEQYFNYMGILATEGNYDSMTDFKTS